MHNRRDFLKDAASAAGVLFTGCNLLNHRAAGQSAPAPSKQRRVAVGGRPVRTIPRENHSGKAIIDKPARSDNKP